MMNKSIESLRRASQAYPRSIDAALEYWRALSNVNGYDFRSDGQLLDVFKAVACSSPEGAFVFAEAYFELLESSGDAPALDEELRNSLAGSVAMLPLEKAAIVERVISPNAMGHDSYA